MNHCCFCSAVALRTGPYIQVIGLIAQAAYLVCITIIWAPRFAKQVRTGRGATSSIKKQLTNSECQVLV
jgi:hypothetical protein